MANQKAVTALMIGDVSGTSGLAVLERLLPELIREYAADLTVVNGENAADGFGITEAVLNQMLSSGADIVTSGNHVWEKRDFWPVMDNSEQIIRPANYPAGVPGRGWAKINKNGINWLIINLQGRDMMSSINCPFKAFDEIFSNQIADNPESPLLTLVDFHAEANREKEALAYYLDGRAAVIAGTHTHVQTADERLLPKGSAYISDLGMTGSTKSIIGMDIGICLKRMKTQVPLRMECAQEEAAVQGIAVKIDSETGKALLIQTFNRS